MRERERGKKGERKGKGERRDDSFLQDNFSLNVEGMSEITIKAPQ